MSYLKYAPIVKRESNISKNCKMVFVIVCIILLILTMIFYQESKTPYFFIDNEYKETMIINDPKKDNPILGKIIQIVNLNNKIIPINKIVVIDKDRNVFPIFNTNAVYISINKKGSILQYKLPKPTYITQIIIDVNTLDKNKYNIVNSQVQIRDMEYNIVWKSSDRLLFDKYIDVYVSKPNYIYPIQQQILNPSMEKNDQEAVLGFHLMKNTW